MIELKNISKTYQMGKIQVKALDNVSLKIESGEFVAIMGPSGSGKSTLMHILGLLDRPDEGAYFFQGKDLTRLSDESWAIIRNKLVGFIFQQFHLLARMTALENVQLPLVYAGNQHLKENAKEKLELVGLKDRMSHQPNELSGGQQQRVAIARSLINEPPIIMADEPTGNLDSKSKEEIMGILKRLHQEGKTVIVVTHEKEVADHAKRVIYVRDGKIISDDRREEQKKSAAETADSKLVNGFLSESIHRIGRTKFHDYFKQALFAMISHKMRSLLSILGILIGVASVIAMLALGEGAKISIQKQLASLGSNLLVLRPGSSKVHGIALEAGAVTRFTFKDIAAIKKLDGVIRVSASVSGRGQVVYGNKNWSTQIEGVEIDYDQMRAVVPVVGRFFIDKEIKMRERVAILGTTVARELFGNVNPIGAIIKINLANFKVIGVLPSKGGNSFRDQDDTILVPVTTAMYRMFGEQYIDTIFVEAKNVALLDPLQEKLKESIIRQHRLNKKNEDSFQIRNMADIKNALESTTKVMSLLLGAIAAISLLVGGIGIMNIMLVSVTERTREIG
ncbi:MAG TPA: ABC transporter permease, partial [Candidatus Omnitrophota bacterium]|nr:ABC transporter permease [Candidatus Omnitrophota bacterium]